MTVRNALDETFERTRAEGRAALMPYLTAGFPSPETYVDLVMAVVEAGADVLEIGVPFSDPLLDGSVNQQAQQMALDAGVTPATCLEYAREIRRRAATPLFLMGAYNPMLAFGLDRLCEAASDAGVSGLIVPDLPLDEQAELRTAAQSNGLHVIQMIAPTSPEARVHQVCDAASGFIYCVSVTGVTGARTGVAELARPLVERVRSCTELPVAVGFGIASPDDARAVGAIADGVIVGSALTRTLRDAGDDAARAAGEFVGSLRKALDR